jgi:hypothetical protein
MPTFLTSPLDKQFYAVQVCPLQIVGHGRASLDSLTPKAAFRDNLDTVYATSEDWQASHIVLADFSGSSATDRLLRTLARTLVGSNPIALLYANGTYKLGAD